MRRVQVNLRLPEGLHARVVASARRQNLSVNEVLTRWVADGVDGSDELAGRLPPQPLDGTQARQAVADAVTRGHLHRLVEVPDTRSPGRLLGTTEATFECVCGKSERRKVT